jgi:hypothetical protein
MLELPAELTRPIMSDGRVIAKLMLDLTVYLQGPSVTELQTLIELYEELCPPQRLFKYKIAEFEFWPQIGYPELTASGRVAQAAGVRDAHLEPVRRRIWEGRAFELGFWDGREIDDPDGSWSFVCRRIRLRSTGLHAFMRILVPVDADPSLLTKAAQTIADRVPFHSGHGGLAFVYDSWNKPLALDHIYSLARRFWGVDVEDMNQTLPLMRGHLKTVSWLTLVGRALAQKGGVVPGLTAVPAASGVAIESRAYGLVIRAAAQPGAGDQHESDDGLRPYYAIANAIAPLLLDSAPDFSGARFIESGQTVGWLRRFLEPDGWR